MSKSKPSADSSSPYDSIDQFLTYKVAQSHMALNRQAIALLNKNCSLGLNEWRCLGVLGNNKANSTTSLTETIGLDKAIVSRSIASLEKSGHVKLLRNSTDRRRVEVKLTAKGRRVFNKMLPIMAGRQKFLLDQLNQSEKKQAFVILDKLMNATTALDF